MLVSNKVKVAVAGLAVAGGAVVAIFSPAGLAIGQTSPPFVLQIQVNSPATLVAKGAAADVSVTTTCSGIVSGTTPFVSVSLTESIGGKIASGIAQIAGECTGGSQTFTMLVPASPGKAFKKGTAVAIGTINGCGDVGCENENDQTTIALG